MVVALLVIPASLAGAQAPNAGERATLDAGQQVVRTEAVANSSWPRVTVFRFIAASPEEAAAVFVDYNRHRTYLPNVRHSQISRVVDSATTEVDYIIKVPIVADESYTVRNHVSATATALPENARSYRVTWTLVRASSTKSADGEARFEPYRNGTLLTYQNLVVPGSSLAGIGFIRGRAQREVESTTRAISEQVTNERAHDRPLLDRQLQALRAIVR